MDLHGEKPAQQWARHLRRSAEMEKRGALIRPFDMTSAGTPLGADFVVGRARKRSGLRAQHGLQPVSREQLAKIGCDDRTQLRRRALRDHGSVRLVRRSREGDPAGLPFAGIQTRTVRSATGCKVVLFDTQVNIRSPRRNTTCAAHSARQACRDIETRGRHRVAARRNARNATYKNEMDDVVYRRCSFVINENSGARRLRRTRKGGLRDFRRKMNGPHDGLSKWYEVSCEELDFLADLGHRNSGVLGARMMGGGFGGRTINW